MSKVYLVSTSQNFNVLANQRNVLGKRGFEFSESGVEPAILHFPQAPGEAGNTSSRTTLMNVLYSPKTFLFLCPCGFMLQRISK